MSRAIRKIYQAVLALGWLCLASTLPAFAQTPAIEGEYAVFVSQRMGALELFALNLATRQVSQLTNTGRSHLVPATSYGTRDIVFAAREGSNYELFSAQVGAMWRSRRPTLIGLQRLTTNTIDEVSPSISATGVLLTFVSGNGIELMTTSGGGRQTLLTNDGRHRDYCPALAPEGQQLAFISDRGGTEEIWLLKLSTGELRQLTTDALPLGGLSWSADGKQLAFTTANTKTTLSGIAIADTQTGRFRVLTDNGDSSPALSARGDRLLFTSQRDGDPELYLLNLNTGVAERLTHSAGLDDGAVFLPNPTTPRRGQ
jgi:Tol biopolymer transport system component